MERLDAETMAQRANEFGDGVDDWRKYRRKPISPLLEALLSGTPLPERFKTQPENPL